jgi:hypothetical protein
MIEREAVTEPAVEKPVAAKTIVPSERPQATDTRRTPAPSDERQAQPAVPRFDGGDIRHAEVRQPPPLEPPASRKPESIPLDRPMTGARAEKEDLTPAPRDAPRPIVTHRAAISAASTDQQADRESSSSGSAKLIVGSLAAAVILGLGAFFVVRHRQPIPPAAAVEIPTATPAAAAEPAPPQPEPTQPVAAPPEPTQPVAAQPEPTPATAAAEPDPAPTATTAPVLAPTPHVRTPATSTASERVPESRPSLEATAPPPTASAASLLAPAALPQPPTAPAQVAPEPSAATIRAPLTSPVPPGPRTEPPAQNSQPAPPSEPAPYRGPLNGTLTYSGPPIVENGEVVFRNLPPLRLALTYDQDVWEARLSPAEGTTQRLILRNKKPGTQKKCVVTWRVIQ